MAKRKPKTSTHSPSKRPRLDPKHSSILSPSKDWVDHPVLSHYYPRVLSLRQYLIDQLPATSKKRRRRILHCGKHGPDLLGNGNGIDDIVVRELLDSTLIGQPQHATHEHISESIPRSEMQAFTQQLSGSTAGVDSRTANFMQSEVVDFVIWLLFRRNTSAPKPSHLLCTGFQRCHSQTRDTDHVRAVPGIPGLMYSVRNSHVDTMKNAAWSSVLQCLGEGGQKVMTNLLLNCGIFIPIEASRGFYYQLSGTPLIELKTSAPLQRTTGLHLKALPPRVLGAVPIKRPTNIKFIRSRMMYAKASLISNGQVRFGLQRIHILNRLVDLDDREQLVHLLKYMFPRQFGLHNAFVSQIDSRDTALGQKDYTLREKEISRQYVGRSASTIRRLKTNIPRRLRGHPAQLVRNLHRRHGRCVYQEVLRYYCPVQTLDNVDHGRRNCPRTFRKAGTDTYSDPLRDSIPHTQVAFTDLASPISHVSAFCRAIITKVVPSHFWGDNETLTHNYYTIMRYIDCFIGLRRCESLSIHQVTQELKVHDMCWLRPPHIPRQNRTSASDIGKRREILHEFVYYLFDSILIPLIRSNFYVTESNVHKQRLFYYRHDVWRMLAEPSLSLMKVNMFEEIKGEGASKIMASRCLGYSHVRLLPKTFGARPIMNLKRRMQINKNGRVILGCSINSTLAAAFRVLNYEKTNNPERLGSSLFSVGDIFPRLRTFKSNLLEHGLWGKRLYFCKVDVVSCFDTIPQQRLVEIVEDLISAEEYEVHKQAEIRPADGLRYFTGLNHASVPVTRFKSIAGPVDQRVHKGSELTKAQTILVDLSVQRPDRRKRVITLLREHLTKNLVKIGRRFYRQKNGIPQGSVVSTLLCSLFYAELEQDYLSFASERDSMLMRLLDDFLLITTDRSKAERFLQTMHDGKKEYGVQVKKEKSLTNFPAKVNDTCLAKIGPGGQFPYCGILIDTATLEVQKNPERPVGTTAGDALTVDMSRVPGQTFHRKTLNGFKIQMQQMFLDASHNSRWRVLSNLYYGFRKSAETCWEYLKCLGAGRKGASRLLIKTVQDLVILGYLKVRHANRSSRARLICRRQVQWVGYTAFQVAFQRRQTHYSDFLHWIKVQLVMTRPEDIAERQMVQRAVEEAGSLAPRSST